jgi:hypothetical protein
LNRFVNDDSSVPEQIIRGTSAAPQALNSERMTLFMPGHNPPQVTILARVRLGSKNNLARGPTSSNSPELHHAYGVQEVLARSSARPNADSAGGGVFGVVLAVWY